MHHTGAIGPAHYSRRVRPQVTSEEAAWLDANRVLVVRATDGEEVILYRMLQTGDFSAPAAARTRSDEPATLRISSDGRVFKTEAATFVDIDSGKVFCCWRRGSIPSGCAVAPKMGT